MCSRLVTVAIAMTAAAAGAAAAVYGCWWYCALKGWEGDLCVWDGVAANCDMVLWYFCLWITYIFST